MLARPPGWWWGTFCIQNGGKKIRGQPRLRITVEEFNHCIDNCGLVELKSLGGNMSWTNRKKQKLGKTRPGSSYYSFYSVVQFGQC